MNKITWRTLVILLLATLCLALPASAAPAADFCPNNLKIDYRVNPLGLEAHHLHFSWQLNFGDQAAWQVQAASTPEQLADGKAGLWDSDKRAGSATTQIAYEGAPLTSRQRVWWRVRVWDKLGSESVWSPPAYFEMGLLQPTDWQKDRKSVV